MKSVFNYWVIMRNNGVFQSFFEPIFRKYSVRYSIAFIDRPV